MAKNSSGTSEARATNGGKPNSGERATIRVGAALLALQGVAEVIKRIGYLRGEYDMDTHYEKPLQ
jgi:TRAP-type mannitol/chloroaromatic compound transport system permease small subunit